MTVTKEQVFKDMLTSKIKEALKKHKPKTVEETEAIVKSIIIQIEKKMGHEHTEKRYN